MRIAKWLFGLMGWLVMGWLVACGGSPVATPVPQPPKAKPVVSFNQSGGIAGIQEDWTIYDDGRILRNGQLLAEIDLEEVAALQQELVDLGLKEVAGDYVPADTCCDRFLYTLNIYEGENFYEITALDGTPDTPEQIWAAIELIRSVLSATSSPN